MAGKWKETGYLLAPLLFNTVKQTGTTKFVILLYIFYFMKYIKLFKVVLKQVIFISKELCLIIIIIITTSINIGQVYTKTSFISF